MAEEKWVLPKTPFIPDPKLFPEVIQKHVQEQMAIKENFIARYLAETGAKIEETVLIEERSKDGLTVRYWCEPKTKNEMYQRGQRPRTLQLPWKPKGTLVVDLKGFRSFKLLAVKPSAPQPSDGERNSTYWICRCDCGNVVRIPGHWLTRAKNFVKSCGCMQGKRPSSY